MRMIAVTQTTIGALNNLSLAFVIDPMSILDQRDSRCTMLTRATKSIAMTMNTKNRESKLSGRKLRVVRSDTPLSKRPIQTLFHRNRNHELTYPNSHARYSRNNVDGSRSRLIPPVTATSYHSRTRSHTGIIPVSALLPSTSVAV